MKRTKIAVQEIDSELAQARKPTARARQDLPFDRMDDRSFEALLYKVFARRLENHEESLLKICDQVYLMQGVSERGRDCSLTLNGVPTGLIQCKRLSRNVTQREVLLEVVKFILHYLEDHSLIGDPDNFTYFFAAAKGFTEDAIVLMQNLNNNVTSVQDELKKLLHYLPNNIKGLSIRNMKPLRPIYWIACTDLR